MKSFFRPFLAAVLAVLTLALVGCGTTKIVTVKETNTVVLSTPKAYTTPTPIPAPHFTKDQYMASTWEQRAQYNAVLNVNLYEAIGQCNADKASIRLWEAKEKANVEKSNKPTK